MASAVPSGRSEYCSIRSAARLASAAVTWTTGRDLGDAVMLGVAFSLHEATVAARELAAAKSA
jgi:hypothetical protein